MFVVVGFFFFCELKWRYAVSSLLGTVPAVRGGPAAIEQAILLFSGAL